MRDIDGGGRAWDSAPARFALFAALALAVFWPGLDNGFISDDYVTLERSGVLSREPLYLFTIPPENFRTTLYLVFLALKSAAGCNAWVFYVFAMFVHALNAALLSRLADRLTADRATGLLTGVLFVSYQNPQEAVLWLNGMHESLQALFILAAVLLWLNGRWGWSAAAYTVALFSKESAVLALALIPIAEYWRDGRFRLRLRYAWLAAPSALLAALFLALRSSNSLLVGGYYEIGWGAVGVFLYSLHKIALPWLYLFGALAWWKGTEFPFRKLAAPALWMCVSLLPYIFLTYQNRVPSRHQYMACMGAAALLAILLGVLRNRRLALGLAVAFVIVNAGYVGVVKDRQFEQRAAPTERLLVYLRSHPPRPLALLDYPFNPWTAKLTTRCVAGWSPDLIGDSPCEGCTVLRWDPASEQYRSEP